MRSKEFAHDYRYFPDPDLLPVTVLEPIVEEVRRSMPELPAAKVARFMRDYAITPYDAGVLTGDRALADYFEAAVRAGAPAKTAANWIAVELLRRLNDVGKDIAECPVAPAALADLLKQVESGKITAASGKKVFATMFESGQERGGNYRRRRAGANQRRRRDRKDRARGRGEESGQRGEISQRKRRRVQVFRGPGDARDARPGKSAARERSVEASAFGIVTGLRPPDREPTCSKKATKHRIFEATADDGRTVSSVRLSRQSLHAVLFPESQHSRLNERSVRVS